MALRSFFRKSTGQVPLRYKAWLQMITDKATSSEDQASVSALGTICDYYSVSIPQDEVKSKNNFEVKWEDWSHLQSKEIVEKLKAKIEAVNSEEYETEVLVHEVATETEELKKLGYLLEYNYTLHEDFVKEKESIIENLGHARPYGSLDMWERQTAYPYYDQPYRWDKELGYPDSNNDQTRFNVVATNALQFQKDGFKSAVHRYYYDYLGRHQFMCTAEKLSGVLRED
jgi:hypothetical protein